MAWHSQCIRQIGSGQSLRTLDHNTGGLSGFSSPSLATGAEVESGSGCGAGGCIHADWPAGRAERLNQWLTHWRDKLSGQAGTKVALQLLDMIAANPFLTPRGAEAKLNLAYNTVMRAIGQMEKLKVLKEVSEAKRDRVYCAKAILDILEEPARLTPDAPN